MFYKSITFTMVQPVEGENEVCRICFDHIDLTKELDRIISPCRCIGSRAFVHIECFNQDAKNRCEICHIKYITNLQPFHNQQQQHAILFQQEPAIDYFSVTFLKKMFLAFFQHLTIHANFKMFTGMVIINTILFVFTIYGLIISCYKFCKSMWSHVGTYYFKLFISLSFSLLLLPIIMLLLNSIQTYLNYTPFSSILGQAHLPFDMM